MLCVCMIATYIMRPLLISWKYLQYHCPVQEQPEVLNSFCTFKNQISLNFLKLNNNHWLQYIDKRWVKKIGLNTWPQHLSKYIHIFNYALKYTFQCLYFLVQKYRLPVLQSSQGVAKINGWCCEEKRKPSSCMWPFWV